MQTPLNLQFGYSQNGEIRDFYGRKTIATFIKVKRKQLKLTQPELAERAGVGLRFVRELEQGKQTVQLDKVNQVLALFGGELGVVQKTES